MKDEKNIIERKCMNFLFCIITISETQEYIIHNYATIYKLMECSLGNENTKTFHCLHVKRIHRQEDTIWMEQDEIDWCQV